MNGIEMNELYELVSHCHESDFEYNGTTYVLQPEVNDGIEYLVIWDCTSNAKQCIAKQEIKKYDDIPHDVIDAILSEKCFDGKSFLEIEQEITVTVIYQTDKECAIQRCQETVYLNIIINAIIIMAVYSSMLLEYTVNFFISNKPINPDPF